MALARARSGSNSLGRAISGISSLQPYEFDRHGSGLYSLEHFTRARGLHNRRKILDTEGKMTSNRKLRAGLFLAFLFAMTVAALSQPGPDAIASRFGEVDGMKIHYLTAGHGPAVILLHGYTQTSRMWRPLIPKLTDKFTVVAPDLPGIGDSGIPENGLDMKTAAIRIHAL